jgi:hypothetical protein
MRNPCVLAVALAIGAGCGGAGSAHAAAGAHDEPVPPGEPRAELDLVVDLEPSGECEERFDLEVYVDQRIELVGWDERHGTCAGRKIRVRYLRDKIDAASVTELVRKHARRAETAAAAPAPETKKETP